MDEHMVDGAEFGRLRQRRVLVELRFIDSARLIGRQYTVEQLGHNFRLEYLAIVFLDAINLEVALHLI